LPHIYSNTEIIDLLQACQTFHPAGGLRGASCRTLFGLLAATAMCISEAIALEQQDVDLNAGLLQVRNAKFDKSRWVPIHQSVTKQLRCDAPERDGAYRIATYKPFFIGDYARPLTARSGRYTLKMLRKQWGRKKHEGITHIRLFTTYGTGLFVTRFSNGMAKA